MDRQVVLARRLWPGRVGARGEGPQPGGVAWA
jgi:hypothetical protein